MKSMGEWRKVNMRNFILDIIRREGKASKYHLQKTTRYSMTTVLTAIEELVAAGLILSAGKGESNGGRRPEYFVLNPEGGYFIGIDFNVLAMYGATINFRGETVDTRRLQLDRAGMTPARMTQTIIDMVEDLYAPLRATDSRCLGIGIGMPGLIDYRAGAELTYHDFSPVKPFPIQRALENRFGIPVYVDHNVNAIALAYKVLDDEHQSGDFVLFSIRKGIRIGAIVNGEILRGRNNSAGEIGHVPVPGNKRNCVCGRQGCLDTLASTEGIARQLQEGVWQGRFQQLYNMVGRDPNRLDAASFIDSVLAGHVESIALLSDISDHLALALANVINLLNPPKVILYGELTRLGEPFLSGLHHRLENLAFHTNVRNLPIIPARLNYSIGAIGAAALALIHAYPFTAVGSNALRRTLNDSITEIN